MKIHTFLILFLLPVSLLGQSPAKPPVPKPTPTPAKKPVNVEKVELDRTEIILPCRPGAKSRVGDCNDNDSQLINVHTVTSSPIQKP